VAASAKLMLKRRDIDVLEEPETKDVVNLVECSDNGSCEVFVDKSSAWHASQS
jgi:hypothetical protein